MKVPQPHMQGLWAEGENKQDELFRKEKRTTNPVLEMSRS